MASNIANAVRSAGLDAMCVLLDAGASEPSMEIQESDNTVLLTIGLNATRAIAAAVNGVGTFNDPTTGGSDWTSFSQNPSASGTAAKAVLKDGDGNILWQLSVGTSGAEVNFDTLSFDTAVAVTTTTDPTMTMPAG